MEPRGNVTGRKRVWHCRSPVTAVPEDWWICQKGGSAVGPVRAGAPLCGANAECNHAPRTIAGNFFPNFLMEPQPLIEFAMGSLAAGVHKHSSVGSERWAGVSIHGDNQWQVRQHVQGAGKVGATSPLQPHPISPTQSLDTNLRGGQIDQRLIRKYVSNEYVLMHMVTKVSAGHARF